MTWPQFDRLCGLVVRVSGYRCRGPGFDFQRFQIFWEAAGLDRGPLSLVRTTEELSRLTTVGIRCADHAPPSIRKKLSLTSPASGGRSVGIVRSRTKAMAFSFLFVTPIYAVWYRNFKYAVSDSSYVFSFSLVKEGLHSVSGPEVGKSPQLAFLTEKRG
jgi:hypothetical protein